MQARLESIIIFYTGVNPFDQNVKTFDTEGKIAFKRHSCFSILLQKEF